MKFATIAEKINNSRLRVNYVLLSALFANFVVLNTSFVS